MTFNDQPVNVRPYFAVESSIARTKNKMWNMNLCPIGHLIVYFEVDHSGRSEPRRPPAGRGGRSRCPVADLATRDRARHTSDPTPARTPQQGTAESPRGLPQGGHDGDQTSKTGTPNSSDFMPFDFAQTQPRGCPRGRRASSRDAHRYRVNPCGDTAHLLFPGSGTGYVSNMF